METSGATTSVQPAILCAEVMVFDMPAKHSKTAAERPDTGRRSVRKRRVDRTQEALLDAFRDLLLSQGYDTMTVRDVIARANVGRSTFYEHFQNKEDLFRASVASVLDVLAGVVDGKTSRLTSMVEHFWENRRLLRAVMGGPARCVMVDALEHAIDGRLDRSLALCAPIPLRLVAAQLAGAQLGLIEAWIRETRPTAPAAIAAALIADAKRLAGAATPRGL
jgi:AcrR family transcriptional regulator